MTKLRRNYCRNCGLKLRKNEKQFCDKCEYEAIKPYLYEPYEPIEYDSEKLTNFLMVLKEGLTNNE